MKKYKILIFPCGSENALEIYNSLKYNLHLDIYGASSKSDHASYIYPEEKYFEGNYNINDEKFIENFNLLIDYLKIDIVIPTHDTVALYFAKYSNLFKSKILTSDFETAQIARQKKLTYELFKQDEFCPIIYNSSEEFSFPIILKPNIGEGSKNVVKAADKKTFDFYYNEEMLIVEYLPGEELTVDCFTDRHGELRFIGPRTRERVQMGISFRSKSVEVDEEIERIARKINSKLKFRGAWFFQIKKSDKGIFKLLEVSVRQAGTMALYRQLGINFALLGIFDLLENDISILKNNLEIELDRCLYNRYKMNLYYEKVYIDFDDTLIVNNQVNTLLMQYIYQCINKGIKVYLITKHEFSLEDSMKKFRIAQNLFDKIYHLNMDDKKYLFMESNNAIFIDNYFLERKEVQQEILLNVFDVDAIESLLD